MGILQRSAPLTYQVKTHSGLTWKRHMNQLHAMSSAINPNCHNNANDFIDIPLSREETLSNSSSTTSDLPVIHQFKIP